MQKIAVAVFVATAGCAQVAPPPTTITRSKSPAETRDAAPIPPIAIPEPRSAVEAYAAGEPPPELPRVATLERPANAPSASLWVRINAGFGLPGIDNALVRESERWYSSRPEYVARMIERSRRFLFYVVEEVEKRGMPTEIALLPMIESAYNPVAYSKADASGMWQFIASTGKHYGLSQNWWYDGRRDVIEATNAALDYLEKLHGMFGDWPLALAAYNCGEGAVGRAIERNRARGLETSYEALTLPAETREYVPKLIAVRNILANPSRYGLTTADIPNEPYLESVGIEEHIDVALAARLAELSVDEFRFLNPAHRKPIIKAGEGRRIVLPRRKLRAFLTNLRKHDQPLLSWKVVRLRRGQKLQHIATSHGMTIDELKRASGVSGRRFAVGQPLLVRVRAGVEAPELPDIASRPVSLPKAYKAAKARFKARRSRAERAIVRLQHAKRPAVRPKSVSKDSKRRRR